MRTVDAIIYQIWYRARCYLSDSSANVRLHYLLRRYKPSMKVRILSVICFQTLQFAGHGLQL
jgi:hypothetical protein